MKRFKVLTRECAYVSYIVEAEDEDDVNLEGVDGKEIDWEFDIINIEPLPDEVTP